MRLLVPGLIALCCAGSGWAQPQFSTGPRPGSAAGPASLFGVWGSPAQCQAHRGGDETNPARLPYVIDNEWIRQGFIYCHISWRGQRRDGDETRAWADARCGEDDLRDYRLQFSLQARRLQIRWSPDFVARGLEFCRS